MKTKKCVGAVIYNGQNQIFLMSSSKWKYWVVPGGEIQDNETEEQALRREIKEELGIEIDNLIKVGKKIKPASSDFKDKTTEFIFIDFFAKALQNNIIPNKEITDFGWFSIEQALKLPLLDTTRDFINQYKNYKIIKQT